MPRATWAQSSFLGGEWSPFMQGRWDHPRYKTALSTMYNAMPTEEGAFQRRPGFKHVSRTRGGNAAVMFNFSSVSSTPYQIELTTGHLRMFNGTMGAGLVYNDDIVSVTAISTANPAVMTIASDKGWVTGTQVNLIYGGSEERSYPGVCAVLKRRTFTLTKLTGTTFQMADAVTGLNIVGATVGFNSSQVPVWAASILDAATPWPDISGLRLVQNQQTAVFLKSDTEPYVMEFTKASDAASFSAYCGSCNNLGSVELTRANMVDGPYLDIDDTGAFLLPAEVTPGTANIIKFTIAFPTWNNHTTYDEGAFVIYDDGGGLKAYVSVVDDNFNHAPASGGPYTYWAIADAGDINGPGGFTSDDIGRHVRLLSAPPLWDSATAYAVDDPVTYNGLYYTALEANTDYQPDINLGKWAPTNSVAVATWTWGRITAVGSGTNPRFTCEILGPPLLYKSGSPPYYIYTFRFGLFGSRINATDRVGYPTCGTFHQERLWLSGAFPNRVDASRPNGRYFEFTPTAADGTVADDHGISITFNASNSNYVYWMRAMAEGILCGSDGGEWLIAASQLNDPLTPTSVQAHVKTRYKCANMEPADTGMSTVFVQRYGRRVLEYVPSVFNGKFSAPNLTEAARHATLGGVAELAYQEEQMPILWARRNNTGEYGLQLSGITYRRNDSYVTDQPNFAAWHRHELGGSHTFKSICTSPSDDGTTVTLNAITLDNGLNGVHRFQQMTPIPEDTQSIYTSFYLDDAIVPPPMEETGGDTGLIIYGLWHLEAQEVDVWLGGVDAGTYTVTDGHITVPYGSDADGLLTRANLVALSGGDFGICETHWASSAGGTVYSVPCVVGHAYSSIGQVLRPATTQDTGTPFGPPMGKSRRGHRYAMQVASGIAGTVSVGTDPAHLRPAQFYDTDYTTTLPKSDTFSGVYVDELDDDYDFNSALYWSIERPYPFTLLAASVFLASEER